MSNEASDVSDSEQVIVLGVGYVGLTSAACLAHLGHSVLAIDIDEVKIERLRHAELPIFEDGLETLVSEGIAANRLSFSTSLDAVGQAGVVLLCIQTPPAESGEPDMTFLQTAVASLRDRLRPGAVIITKSTVPVGTQAEVTRWLNRPDVSVVSNPEFLREGRAVSDFLQPDRVVIGSDNDEAAQIAASLYSTLDTTIQHTDPASAELIKYAANAFLATKISFVNEISRLCDSLGANIDAVADGLGSDQRIGAKYLSPGPGWGGSCFPKDVLALVAASTLADVPLAVLQGALASNQQQFEHVVSQVMALLPADGQQASVAVWGLAFKAGTDDTRVSPALEIISRLKAKGVAIRAHDPVATIDPSVAPMGDMYEICDNADLLLVATEWPAYADADPEQVVERLRTPRIFDSRNIINVTKWSLAGAEVMSLGRPNRST